MVNTTTELLQAQMIDALRMNRKQADRIRELEYENEQLKLEVMTCDDIIDFQHAEIDKLRTKNVAEKLLDAIFEADIEDLDKKKNKSFTDYGWFECPEGTEMIVDDDYNFVVFGYNPYQE